MSITYQPLGRSIGSLRITIYEFSDFCIPGFYTRFRISVFLEFSDFCIPVRPAPGFGHPNPGFGCPSHGFGRPNPGLGRPDHDLGDPIVRNPGFKKCWGRNLPIKIGQIM